MIRLHAVSTFLPPPRLFVSPAETFAFIPFVSVVAVFLLLVAIASLIISFCFVVVSFLLAPLVLCKPSLCGGTCTSCSNIDLWRRTGACDFSMGCCRRRETNTGTGEAAGSEKLYVLICESRAGSPLGNPGVSLCVFFFPLYFSSLVCPPSLPMFRSEFKSQFHSPPYFYLSNLFYIPPYCHFTPLMSFLLPLPLHFCALFFVPRSN